MMTNKKINVRHDHSQKNLFPHTGTRKEIYSEGNNYYCERLLLFDISPFFSLFDEMMRSIFHKYKALQKNIDTKLI